METTTAKLPVLKIFLQAVSLTKKRFPALLRLGAPFIFCVLVWTVCLENDFVGKAHEYMKGSGTIGFAVVIIGGALWIVTTILTGIMAAVGCHRVFLMTPEEVKKTKTLRYSGREARFLRWEIVIGFLIAGVFIIPYSFLSFGQTLLEEKSFYYDIFEFLFLLLIYYIATRCFMVLPATAIDQRDKTLAWSWHLTKGNGWRLALLIFILPFAINHTIDLPPKIDSVIYDIFSSAIWLFIGAVEIGFLSLSYSFLCQNETASPNEGQDSHENDNFSDKEEIAESPPSE